MLDVENVDSFIYMFINSTACLDRTASYLVFDAIKELLVEHKLLQASILRILPILVSNIRRENNLFTGYIDVSRFTSNYDNLIPLLAVIREMNTLTFAERTLLIKRLLEMLALIDLELCPAFVKEVLKLCDKNSFPYCICTIVHFFDQRLVSCSHLSQSSTPDSERMIAIQTAVLNHCYEIAKFDADFGREVLKFCKNNVALYSISGFMCLILLNLAGLDFIRDQILDFLASCITACYKDVKLLIESAFIREAVIDNFDMDELLLKAIKHCCVSDRENISTSLLQLGFLLIKSGLPRSKIIALKSNVKKKDDTLINEVCNNDMNMSSSQEVGQAGIQIVIHLFNKLVSCRRMILDNIQNFILKESHKSSVFVYLELFADLISLKPLDIYDYIDKTAGQPIFEFLCDFPREVALALVNALLPLIRYSASLRNKLIAVILNNILSGRFGARLICVESALVLLKYLRITVDQFGVENAVNSQESDPMLLTQCSQFACTQIADQSKPLVINNLENDTICTEILQIIDASCRQHSDTKAIIYKGLVQVIERNFYFSGKVVLFLLEKLESIIDPRSVENDTTNNNPFMISRLLLANDRDNVLQEQIAVLVSCLAESVRHCRQNMPPSDILSDAIQENKCILDAVTKAECAIEKISTFLCSHDIMEMDGQPSDQSFPGKQVIVDEFIDLYDVVLVHFICSDHSHSEQIEKLFIRKEALVKVSKLDKKSKPVNQSTVISLSALIKSVRYSLESVSNDVKNITNYTVTRPTQRRSRVTQPTVLEMSFNASISNVVIENNDNSPAILQNEKVSIYVLNRAITLVRKIGSPEYRISYRNREEICTILTDFVQLCLDYYIDCLALDNVDGLTSFQRQIMQLCMTMYCLSINKIIQFCTKKIDVLLKITSKIRKHIKTLQLTLGLTKDDEFSVSFKNDYSMSSFIKLNKLMMSRILLVSVRKLYGDIDGILNVTVNMAIYCGMKDARPNESSDMAHVPNRINTFILANLHDWTYNLLKSSKLHFKFDGREIIKNIELSDTGVCRSLISTCLTTARFVMPDSVHFLEKIVADISSKIGSYSTVMQEKLKISFEFIIHPNDIIAEIIAVIGLALDDADWLLLKWKCGWQEFKQRKAVHNSQRSYISSTPSEFVDASLTLMTDQDRNLYEQLHSLCSIMNKMTQCCITNVPRLHSLIKLCIRLFDQLTSLTKQYISLTKAKIGSCPSRFEELVRISGGVLSPQASQFIVYIQKIESTNRNNTKEDKKSDDDSELISEDNGKKKTKKSQPTLDSQVGRTDKDIRLIPQLVFSIEQYQRYLIELQKISKIDLMSRVKTLNSRDFRIDKMKLQESLDKNATVYMSDDDEEGVEGEVTETESTGLGDEDPITSQNSAAPPLKRQRT